MKYVGEALKRIIQLFFGMGLFDFPVFNWFRIVTFKLMFRCGKAPVLESHVSLFCSHGLFGSISLGDRVFLGRNVKIDYSGTILINSDVWISENTSIYTHGHKLDSLRIDKKCSSVSPTSLHLETGSWVGANTVILESVSYIGAHSVIGAGSIVTKNVPPYAVVAGNPARIIKYLDFKPAE